MVITMSKETYYFQHDFEPTSDPKVQVLLDQFGGLGYGVFWRLIEMLHSSESHRLELKDYIYMAIAKQMKTDVEQIKVIVSYLINPCELLMTDGQNYWSNRVDENIRKRKEISEQRSLAGKKGAIAKQALADAKQV